VGGVSEKWCDIGIMEYGAKKKQDRRKEEDKRNV